MIQRSLMRLWVAGFGGEYGTMTPAVMTTDDTGCEKGYVGGLTGSPANAFESTDGHPENPNCNYTSTEARIFSLIHQIQQAPFA